MMQQLLNKASKIPGLLERFDIMRGSVNQVDIVATEKLRQDFQDTLESLQRWESDQRSQASSPLLCTKPISRTSAPPDAKDLWFVNLMVANSLTYCWAFEIIARSHLGMLGTSLVVRHKEDSQPALCPSFEPDAKISVANLAEMICDSMTYLMQPEMKLYGPTSTFFTLRTAIQVFKGDPDEYSVQISRCQQIVAQLAALGLRPPTV